MMGYTEVGNQSGLSFRLADDPSSQKTDERVLSAMGFFAD